jgi:cytoskeletal protein CcmA (bactofilin family)
MRFATWLSLSLPEEEHMERAEIGASIVIKGSISANEDLIISGKVEGAIDVKGHTVIVRTGADVVADVHAHAIVVAGQVLGALHAEEAIELQSSAEIEGELAAPILRVHDGAVFNGKAETTKRAEKSSLQLAS